MELEKLIDILEEALEDATKIPFMSKVIIDKEDFFEMIKDIRLKIPEEVKEAQKITADRHRIINDAKQEADSILKSAADKVTIMVSEHEIVRSAEEKARQIMEETQTESRNMRVATKEYVTDTLNSVENTLNEVLIRVREDRNGF